MARKNVTTVFEAFLNNESKPGASISCICEDGVRVSRVIYSYAMPIAKILFNHSIAIIDRSKSPSVTTSSHISGVTELAESEGLTIEIVLEIV